MKFQSSNDPKPAAPATTKAMESFMRDFNALMSTRQFQENFIRAASLVMERNRLSSAMTPPPPYGK